MAALRTGTDFLAVVEASRLLSTENVSAFRAVAAAEPAEAVAERLVQAQLLTQFQAQALLGGRPPNFFLTAKYKILDLLGTGGMGRVYLCEHLTLRRLVAVKVLTLDPGKMGTVASVQGVVERFYREAHAVAALDHKNIVRAFDVDQIGDTPFLVMEYVDGIDLERYVEAHGPVEPNRAADYIRQAAEGLQHAHAAGLIHRDVKPLNLFLDRAGVVRLLDLGLARFQANSHLNRNLTERYDPNAMLGTVDYIAPEQALASSNVDIRADIYSLGCTLYFLLTGRVVFEATGYARKLVSHQMSAPPPIGRSRAGVPEGLENVFQRMVAKQPGDRFQTPREVADALAPFALPPPGPPNTSAMPLRTGRTARLGLHAAPVPATGPLVLPEAVPLEGLPAQETTRINFATLPAGRPVAGAAGRGPRSRTSGFGLWLVALGSAAVAGLLAWALLPRAERPPEDGPPAPTGPSADRGPEDAPKPPPPRARAVAPAEAALRVGERLTVQFVVGSVGGKSYVYLNSRRDFTSRDNFAVALPPRVQTGRWARAADDVVGKTIRATGVVKLFKDAPQIEVADAKDLEVLD